MTKRPEARAEEPSTPWTAAPHRAFWLGIGCACVAALLLFASQLLLGAEVAPFVLLLAVGLAARAGGRPAGIGALAACVAMAAAFQATDGDGIVARDVAQLGLMALVGGTLLLGAKTPRPSREPAPHPRADAGQRPEHAPQSADSARFRCTLDGLATGVVLLDKAGNVLDWNPAALAVFGFANGDSLRGRLDDVARQFVVTEPGGAPVPVEQWPVARAMRGERILDAELDVRVVGTVETKRVRFSSALVAEPHGKGEFVVVSMLDVTAERRAQAELQRTSALLRAVVEGTSDAVFVKDLEGRYVLINDAGARAVGKSVGEVLGRDDVPLFGAEAAAALRARDREVMLGGSTQVAEETLSVHGRSHTWLAMKGPLHDATGAVQGLIGISRDITDRKRAEAERAAMQEHLRVLLEHTSAQVAMFDREMRYLACSRSWCSDLGLGATDVIGRSHYELFPDLREDWRAIHRRCLAGAVESSEADTFPLPDGSVMWLRWEVRPWRDAAGEIGGIVIFSENITARRGAEDALRESEDRYRRLVEVLPDAVFLQADERIRYVNPAFLRLVGAAAASEVLGRSPFEFFAPEFHPVIRSRIAAMRQAGQAVPAIEERIVRRDGRAVPVEVTATPIVDHGVPSVLVVLHDVSEKHRTMGLLQSVLGSVGDAILVVDEHGVVRSANAATERLFGREIDTVCGQPFSLLVAASAAPWSEMPGVGPQQPASGAGVARVVEAVRADGSRFPAELAVTEFTMDGSRHFTAVLRDITERRQLELQYQQAQKMEAVGRLAGGVAHDFNNLLTVINGHTELMLLGAPPESPVREDLLAIQEAGNRAARLTRQLLTFSRQGVVAPRVLDLGDLVGSSVKLLRRLIGEDVHIELVVAPGLPPVRMDPGQCEQLLMNLVVNARDAMPTGGRLRIALAARHGQPGEAGGPAPGERVVLTVADTGCGMTEEVRRRIFEPFFTTKPAGHGTGLGLAVVHGIVSHGGGSIDVRSELGVGTTFEISLPAVADAPAEVERPSSPPLPANGATVLLVEDEAAVRQIARTALESHGYTVLDADGGKLALELAAGHRGAIDLLLTDVVMPDLSGREIVETLRATRPSLRILYTSGYTNDAMVQRGVVTAEASFLAKPFTPLELLHKVASVLAQSA